MEAHFLITDILGPAWTSLKRIVKDMQMALQGFLIGADRE
jgi:hypothetical protein